MLDKDNIPRHIAIIMDGNGRWAKERHLPRSAGHRKGIQKLEEVLKAASEMGVRYVTFFAFSTENWERPKREVDMLMRSLDRFLNRQLPQLNRNNIRLIVIGEGDPLPEYVQKVTKKVQQATENNDGLTAVIALNYGSRQEIIGAARRFAAEVASGKRKADDLNESLFKKFLYTAQIPDPDLLIRTSGEMRISNFLLWQLSYAELYFAKKYWPDFGRGELEKAVREYQKRERRFGRVEATKKDV